MLVHAAEEHVNKSHNNQIYLADYLDKIYSRNYHMYHAHNLN